MPEAIMADGAAVVASSWPMPPGGSPTAGREGWRGRPRSLGCCPPVDDSCVGVVPPARRAAGPGSGRRLRRPGTGVPLGL